MKRLLILFVVLFISVSTLNAQDTKRFPATPGDHELTLAVGKEKRIFLLHLPKQYDGRTPLPLVIALHGGGGNGEGLARMSLLSEKADKERFIVVYPYGSGLFTKRMLTWNSGNCCGYALKHSIDDVGFIRSLIYYLEAHWSVDSTRVYATGMSNGGKMTYVLACELADQIAAIAPVAGSMEYPACKPSRAVPVIIFHGMDDEHVRYDGGEPKKRLDPHARIDSSVSFAVSYWVRQNKCSTPPERHEQGNIIQERYTGGDNESEVVLYAIKNGKHAWPGGTKGWAFGDTPTQELSVTDVMWEFFSRHHR